MGCLELCLTSPRSVAEDLLMPLGQLFARPVVRVSSRREGAQYHREEHDEEQDGQRDAEYQLQAPGGFYVEGGEC